MKKIFFLIGFLMVSLCLCSGCQSEQTTWTVCFYVCGSDLESKWGSASKNLSELVPEEMPDNLTFVVETGGAKLWQDERFDPTSLQRWEVTNQGFVLAEEQPLASMGAEGTLESFLSFCKENYPADHTMLIFWDHGAGTLYGACRDTNYDGDMLTLTEMHNAVSHVFGETPLDIVGFDCCLMATVDVADLFQDTARYLIASEESEPSAGWSYTGMVQAVAETPDITPEALGTQIVEGFQKKCTEAEDFGIRTLSMTNLSKIGAVTAALEDFGADLLRDLYAEPAKTALNLSLLAGQTENYGGNSRAQGYRNLIDLWHFTVNCRDFYDYPSAQAVVDAVQEAVVTETAGPYRAFSGGLSIYYPCKGREKEIRLFQEFGRSTALKSLYELCVSGTLGEEEAAFVASLGLNPKTIPQIETFHSIKNCDTEVRKTAEGNYVVSFGEEAGNCVTNAMVELYRREEDGTFLLLGSHDAIKSTFETATFEDRFDGIWLTCGDTPLCAELTQDSMDYNVYSIPVQFPDRQEQYFLQVVRDRQTGEWEEIGVRAIGSEPGEARSEPVEEGQELCFLLPCYDASWQTSTWKKVSATYSNAMLHYASLPDGTYWMRFKMEDIQKNEQYSEFVSFRVENGAVVR